MTHRDKVLRKSMICACELMCIETVDASRESIRISHQRREFLHCQYICASEDILYIQWTRIQISYSIFIISV